MCSRVISYWFDVWSYKQLHFYLKLNKINDTMHVKFMMIFYNEDVFKSDYLLILISGHIRNWNCYRNYYVTNHTMFHTFSDWCKTRCVIENPNTVETLYNTINFCWSTHKRHSIAHPKGRGMGCLLWVQRATYFVDLAILSSIKYLL